jgi:hypothetical protein
LEHLDDVIETDAVLLHFLVDQSLGVFGVALMRLDGLVEVGVSAAGIFQKVLVSLVIGTRFAVLRGAGLV